MGFRDPVTTATDPTARQSAAAAANAAAIAQAAANSAQTDAATALTQIIPGSRLAADAIDGKTITGVNIGGATITGSLIRATGTGDVTDTSTSHAFQAGPTTGLNVAIDGNEVGARNNGAWSSLYLNYPYVNNPQQPEGSAVTRRDYVDGKTGAGFVTITPTAANTVTSAVVPFGKTFPTAPTSVVVTPNTSGPNLVTCSVAAITTTGFTLYMTRTTVIATGFYWVAAL